jgi:hypothetical protein
MNKLYAKDQTNNMDRRVLCDELGNLQVDVQTTALPSGASTSAKQDTGNTSLNNIDGKITACNTGAVVVSSSALPSGASTDAKQDTGNTSLSSIDGKITACNTGAVTISVIPTTGTQANASNGITTVGIDENSTTVDCQYVRSIVAMGSVDQICTITIFASQDNAKFYNTGTSFTSSGAEDFYISLVNASGRYNRLQYSATSTLVTATICGK